MCDFPLRENPKYSHIIVWFKNSHHCQEMCYCCFVLFHVFHAPPQASLRKMLQSRLYIQELPAAQI